MLTRLDRLMACASPRYDWESTLPCTRVLRGLDQTTSVTYLDPKNGRPTMIEPWTPLWYYGLGIQIRLQAADPDPDPRPAPTETGSGPSNSPGGGSQGLSAGAAAGIAIGVVLLLLLVIGGAIGACLLKRRARKRQQAQVSPPPTSSAPYETDGQGLPASAVYKTEIAGHQRPAELYPLHHEAAYGSQVHLASQELEQPTKIYEAVNVPYAWPPPPQPQAYEMSPQAGSWTPPPPVYEMSSLSRRTRGG
ncbi:hypothetical protein B0T18DRAFT_123119 [Schizothecium vesticola]|uniref:Uncharacterized protein n=1 Tax=Schizothecium vesticola TaxID=314040 RepID=A0AA40F2Y0_9PEZI|nr:hypothetical protein B0T18DRAFT_123119 [Schizothecium vesticola]